MSRWTEQLAEGRSEKVNAQTVRGAKLITRAPETGLVEMDTTKPDVLGSVESTGLDFQSRLLANPMDHLNRNPKEFAVNCRRLYTEYGRDFVFSVLLLAEDPLHFDAKRSLRVEKNQKQPRQYFGKARPIKIDSNNGSLYTLQIQVVGARVSDLVKDDLTGISLAASVASRDIVRQNAQDGLGGACAGSQIAGITDIHHLAPVLTVADEISAGEKRGILSVVASATGLTPQTIAELAHTHGLEKQVARSVGGIFLAKSTTMNPITQGINGEDTFVVHPNLTDHVVIIPLWDELRGDNAQLGPEQAARAMLASVALGVLATFQEEGVNQIATNIIDASNRGNTVPLQTLREIPRS